MSVLLRRVVPIRSLLAVTPEQARALSAPVRIAMLELLGTRPMSIDELAAELPDHGFRQAPNTLRHHLELLRNAGLVEHAILEQTRGAVLQYYSATGRPLHQKLSPDSEGDLDALAARMRDPVRAAIQSVERSDGARLRRVAAQLGACPRCAGSRARELAILAAVHRAAADCLRRPEVREPSPDTGVMRPRVRAPRRR
jgi:DNA-binding transcriptional ArsR family regulator